MTAAILQAKEDHQKKFAGAPMIAAFDADGTLWDCDIGEGFFNYEIKNLPLKGLPPDPWAHYDEWKLRDPIAAYLWLAQINKGHSYSEIQKWASQAIETRPDGLPIFESQKRVLEFLKTNGFEIYIVTASVRWAVVPAAARLGIPDDHVLGVETRIENGIVTDEQFGPMTWREGKATAILKVTNGVAPIFAAGNTTGDTALLELASHVRLAVSSKSNAGELEKSEAAFQAHARKNGWFAHQF